MGGLIRWAFGREERRKFAWATPSPSKAARQGGGTHRRWVRGVLECTPQRARERANAAACPPLAGWALFSSLLGGTVDRLDRGGTGGHGAGRLRTEPRRNVFPTSGRDGRAPDGQNEQVYRCHVPQQTSPLVPPEPAREDVIGGK